MKFAAPSECGLLEWLKLRVSRLMIEEIAQNDRGEDAAAHFAGIEAQMQADAPLGLLPWHPREVVELECGSEPDRAYTNALPSGQRGHLQRLLACMILLRNAAYVDAGSGWDEDFFVEKSAGALIQLTRSAIAIGGEVPGLAEWFLVWFHGRQADPRVRPFAAFCVVLLMPASGQDACVWVLAEEAQARALLGSRVKSEKWLIGLNGLENLQRSRRRWRDAASAALTRNEGLRELLQRVM